MERYDLNLYMTPYWQGNQVFGEAAMVLENRDGTVPDITLLYPATRILSVRSADLQTPYREGADYVLADGKLHIPATSSIPRVPHSLYYPDQPTQTSKRLNEAFGEGHIFFSEGAYMHTLQLAVTYTHTDTFAGPIPPCKRHLLPKTTQKLNGQLKLCIYGDSICVGGNSTAFVETPPFAPTWWQMFADQLAQAHPNCQLLLQNPSLGGQDSRWGAQEAAERIGYGPDLCIIGFGMNDGTRNVPPEVYQENIKAIMASARKGNPNCEFVLIAPILPNAQVGKFLGQQAAYLPMLEALQTQGVAVADMTTFHKYLLTRKRYCDMSGNNVNHPNDFLARAYAQVMYQTVIGA